MTPAPRPKRDPRRATTPRDPDAARSALSAAAVALAVAVALWLLAPLLHGSSFWQEHFAFAHPREPLPVFAVFTITAALAPAIWPRTWEGELLGRGLRSVAWATIVYWFVGPVLQTPTAAAFAILPALAGMPFAALALTRHAPATGRARIVLAGTLSLGGVALLLALLLLPIPWLARLLLLPLPLTLYALGAPLTLHRLRRADQAARAAQRPASGRPDPHPPHLLDLPPGTLHPGGGTLGLVLTLAGLGFILLIVAPGVPLSGPVAWIAFAFTLPLVARNLLRRRGIALPTALIGPPEARLHSARVQALPDTDLDRLDDALDRYIRSGRGRHELAAALAAIIQPALAHVTPQRIETSLEGLPRGPWGRARRETALASLLGGQAIIDAVRARGATPDGGDAPR